MYCNEESGSKFVAKLQIITDISCVESRQPLRQILKNFGRGAGISGKRIIFVGVFFVVDR